MELNDAICVDGGRLVELFKEEGFGQITLRFIPPGSVVGNHRHLNRNERWTIFQGAAIVRLEYPDGRRMVVEGARRVIDVPAGTGHQLTSLGPQDVCLVWHTDVIYDPEEPDEEEWEWRA